MTSDGYLGVPLLGRCQKVGLPLGHIQLVSNGLQNKAVRVGVGHGGHLGDTGFDVNRQADGGGGHRHFLKA